MRHLVKGSKLGRTSSHRKATLSALAVALIHEQRITTTVAKAKELRRYIEPLITKAKSDSTHNRRQVFSKLQDKYAVSELFEEVGPQAKDRPGGYTRVIKLGFRTGDSAELAMIELVDFNDTPPEKQEEKKRRTRRAGRSKSTSSAAPTPPKQEQSKTEQGVSDQAEEAPVAGGEEGSAADSPEQNAEAVNEAGTESAEKEEKTSSEEVETTGEGADVSAEKSGDFKVDEVKEKLESMSVEEARAFAGEDDRVTVQKALDKKIEDAS